LGVGSGLRYSTVCQSGLLFSGKIIPLKVFIAKNLSIKDLCYNPERRPVLFSSRNARGILAFFVDISENIRVYSQPV
ncbi:MAG: hypothetical protein ABR523_07280, partial [Desulfurivibrionaceae bacterium]